MNRISLLYVSKYILVILGLLMLTTNNDLQAHVSFGIAAITIFGFASTESLIKEIKKSNDAN